MKSLCIIIISLLLSNMVSAQKYYNEAKAMMKAGEPKKALDKINKDIAERGLNPDNGAFKSEVLMYINADQSWESITTTMKAFPNSPLIYKTRAYFYYEVMHDLDKARKDLTRALELNPDDSLRFSIYLNRSGTCRDKEAMQPCIDDARAALAMRPQSLDAMNNLSTSLFRAGNSKESLELLLKIKSMDSLNTGAYINLGYQLQVMENYKDAEKYLLEGLKIAPKDGYLLNNLGYTQFKLGHSQEAIRSINKALQSDPNNSYCYRNLALIYFEQKNMSKACECVNKALALRFTELYGNEVEELKQKSCL